MVFFFSSLHQLSPLLPLIYEDTFINIIAPSKSLLACKVRTRKALSQMPWELPEAVDVRKACWRRSEGRPPRTCPVWTGQAVKSPRKDGEWVWFAARDLHSQKQT